MCEELFHLSSIQYETSPGSGAGERPIHQEATAACPRTAQGAGTCVTPLFSTGIHICLLLLLMSRAEPGCKTCQKHCSCNWQQTMHTATTKHKCQNVLSLESCYVHDGLGVEKFFSSFILRARLCDRCCTRLHSGRGPLEEATRTSYS